MRKCYTIAGVTFELGIRAPKNLKRMEEYLNAEDRTPEFTVDVTDDDILTEFELTQEPVSGITGEFTAIYRKLLPYYLMGHDTFFLHCSAIEVDGAALLFSAPSGTGKSTHRRLWMECYGDRVIPINDDKPLISCKADGSIEVFGTPWKGKENVGSNRSAPVKALFFLKRSPENYSRKMSVQEALTRIMRQIVFPKEEAQCDRMLILLDRFLCSVPVFELGVNMTTDAARTAFAAAFGDEGTEASE